MNKGAETPPPAPVPNEAADEAQAQEAADKVRRGGGKSRRSGTILTGPRGLGDMPTNKSSTILGG